MCRFKIKIPAAYTSWKKKEGALEKKKKNAEKKSNNFSIIS